MILNYRQGTHYTKLITQSHIHSVTHTFLSDHTDIRLLILNTLLLVRVNEKIKLFPASV